ncbi:MAG TPA: hypothetical protein PL045_12735 [Chitinophagaceae bacterium]|nr:hypothetical protein [Chitinophagaceae bacterium]
MKLLTIIILTVCTITATFSKWLLIAAYEYNESYVASALCVNSSNPSSNCHGHCYLGRALNNDEKPGRPLQNAGTEKFEIQLFIEENNNTEPCSCRTNSVSSNTDFSFALQQYMANNFRPPRMQIFFS